MRLDFYKTDDDRWFIDLPEYIEQGGDHEDLEMVRGADKLLDRISNGSNTAQVEVSLTPKLKKGVCLVRVHQDEVGATYINLFNPLQTVWLCHVTQFVFKKDYPAVILVSQISE
jgi:hypothetical protein